MSPGHRYTDPLLQFQGFVSEGQVDRWTGDTGASPVHLSTCLSSVMLHLLASVAKEICGAVSASLTGGWRPPEEVGDVRAEVRKRSRLKETRDTETKLS